MTEELDMIFRGINKNFAIAAVTNAKQTLKDSWILDGGSNIHIYNGAKNLTI